MSLNPLAERRKKEIAMKYKPTYGDKQREAQKQKRDQQRKAKEVLPPEQTPSAKQNELGDDRSKQQDEPAA
jgi:hypothetical protein